MISVKYGWYVAMVVACWAPSAVLGQLPDCTINFDVTCPDTTAECGATFVGGDGCQVIGVPNCYSSGLFSYQVSEGGQLEIMLSGDLVSLRVFFAHQSSGGSGSMRFVDANGQEVDSALDSEGPCDSGEMPPTQLVFFTRSVRTIEVANIGSGNIWIDTFEVNPPCAGAGDCDDGDACTADTCEAGSCVHSPMACDDGVDCTDDACVAGNCVFTPNNADCVDDGLFCNGVESCDVQSGCVSSGDPCSAGELCDEMTDSCGDCVADADCDDGLDCTDDACVAGNCVFAPNNADCVDDGLFCNGVESCDVQSGCVSSGDPCSAGELCDEMTDSCGDCVADADCDDGLDSTFDTCESGECVFTLIDSGCLGDMDGSGDVGPFDLASLLGGWGANPGHAGDLDGNGEVGPLDLAMLLASWGPCPEPAVCDVDADCDDGVFCNGSESCDPSTGNCQDGDDPCPGQLCDEENQFCGGEECLIDADCDDGAFCNGTEACDSVVGTCVVGSDPCPDRMCDESNAACVDCLTDGDCDDGEFCNGGERCEEGACQAGSDPCGASEKCNETSQACVPGTPDDGAGDDDGDGVPNADDHCPGSLPGQQVDGEGCAISTDDGPGPNDDVDEMNGEDSASGVCGAGSCGAGATMALFWTLSTIVAVRLRRRRRRSRRF